MNKQQTPKYRGLRIAASVLANLTAILSANYIVFYILDHFNPGLHFVIHSTLFIAEHLHLAVAALTLITGVLYLILFRKGAFKDKTFDRKRTICILIVDVLLAGALAMTINTYSFDWLHLREVRQDQIISLATMPPKDAPTAPDDDTDVVVVPSQPVQTPVSATEPVDEPGQPQTETVGPTEAPTPEPTPIPGLLGDRYQEKFSEGDTIVEEPNTSETLADGTVKTLIYTVRGPQSAIELYHYQNGSLEYQVADLYVRDITKLAANYLTSGTKMIYEYAHEINARIAINTDYFRDNAKNEGLIIRNAELLQSKPCKYSDLCVVFQDGTVRCYDCKAEKIDNDAIIASYPYHSFYFGPSLLDADGNAKTTFNSTLGPKNPRTAFGYYEPGHYAFICVLGDRSMKDINGNGLGKGKSPGMNFEELSKLCASLGMKAAYNLDGGGSSGMYWNNRLFGHNNRGMGDILAIID